MAQLGEAPWIANPFGLVSLKEILDMARPFDAEGYPLDEVIFGRFFNLLYLIGVLERPPLTQVKLMAELEARVFVPVAPENARYYREPTKDWKEVINRFPGTVSDIEEASKCYALGRYAASVYHSMQIFEHGLLALGRFMQVADPKSGFTAVANALERVLRQKYDELSDFERRNRVFFEQVNQTIQAVKDACRNKISHAEGKTALMTADFSPHTALEIYMSTQAFMRRLASEMLS